MENKPRQIQTHSSSVRVGRLRRSLGAVNNPESDCFKHLAGPSFPKQLDWTNESELSMQLDENALLECMQVLQDQVQYIALKLQKNESALGVELKQNEDLQILLHQLERETQLVQTVDASCRCTVCILF